MAKDNAKDENVKKFKDYSQKSWLTNGKSIKVGASESEILAGKSENLDVKEMYHGDPANTWRIIITNDGTIILLKTSKELK